MCDTLYRSDFQAIKNFEELTRGVSKRAITLCLTYGMLDDFRKDFPSLKFEAPEPQSSNDRVWVKISEKE